MKIEPSKDWYEQSANIEGDSEIGAGVLPVSYQPEMVVIRKDWIYAAQSAIESGIESAMQELATHEVSHGRTTPKNKRAAESMEREIQKMRTAKNQLNDFTFSHNFSTQNIQEEARDE